MREIIFERVPDKNDEILVSYNVNAIPIFRISVKET